MEAGAVAAEAERCKKLKYAHLNSSYVSLCACGSGDSGCDRPRVTCLPPRSGRWSPKGHNGAPGPPVHVAASVCHCPAWERHATRGHNLARTL